MGKADAKKNIIVKKWKRFPSIFCRRGKKLREIKFPIMTLLKSELFSFG